MKRISFVILFAGAMLCGCNGKQGVDDSTKKSVAADLVDNFDTASSARLVFDEEMHDFGQLSAGESVSYSFRFTNKGKKDLIIDGCKASCGCTVPSYPKGRIAPGESNYLTVSFNSSGKAGETYEEVTVASNAQPGRHTLRIRAHVGF